jgi:2-hydroxy-3-keto-5-methylthiopentenyl-1-phosphate phosphatase
MPCRVVDADWFIDLVTFCERRGMPYTTFNDWSTILSTTQDILAGKVSPADVATGKSA